ncbi:hypothetical protein [Halomicrococcus sp. SG-WS-1]
MRETENSWYQDATVYSVDLKTFRDADGDDLHVSLAPYGYCWFRP